MAEIFVFEKGNLTNASKGHLRKAGIVPVEVDDITRCEFVRSSSIISHDDMLWAAFEALQHVGSGYGDKGGPQRERLAVNLFKIADAARRKQNEAVTPPRQDLDTENPNTNIKEQTP